MKQLAVKYYKDLEGTERQSGRKFKYDAFGVEVNGINIYFKPQGRTAWDMFLNALHGSKPLVLRTEIGEFTDEESKEVRQYDALYVEVDGEHIPVKAVDSFGKKLILKFLKSE